MVRRRSTILSKLHPLVVSCSIYSFSFLFFFAISVFYVFSLTMDLSWHVSAIFGSANILFNPGICLHDAIP